MRSRPKPTRELESFSSEVLAEFIRGNVPMRTSKVFAELVYIEARQRLDSINEEIKRLVAKAGTLHGEEHIEEYLTVHNQIDVLWKKHSEVFEVAFPSSVTSPEENNGQPT